MDAYNTINDILVHLFNEIWELEKKAIITEEFKDITNNDMHIIEAIGVSGKTTMSVVAKKMKITAGSLTTEKGEKTYYHHEEFHREMTNAVLNRLDEKEIPVLMKTLDGLSEFFRGYSSEE